MTSPFAAIGQLVGAGFAFLGQAPDGGGAAAPAGGAGGSPGGSFLSSPLFPVVFCTVIFVFLVYMPQRRKDKERQARLKTVKKGDQVVTSAGIVGKIWRVEESEIVLEVDKDQGVRLRFLKSAIQDILPEEGAGGAAATGSSADKVDAVKK